MNFSNPSQEMGKYIIDIDEKDYEQIKNEGVQSHIALADGIFKKAIPYEVKGDLISREALREAFEDLFYNDVDDQERTERLIDNAPSVPLPDFKEGYKQAIIDGKTNFSRPKGEWVGKEEYDDYPNKTVCECSECGKMICVSHNDFPNFCENCGADMRGKEE